MSVRKGERDAWLIASAMVNDGNEMPGDVVVGIGTPKPVPPPPRPNPSPPETTPSPVKQPRPTQAPIR